MLKMENVTYTYEDNTKALEDISIDLEKGNLVGIVGSNGAGKSTMFLNFAGIYRPKKGKVYLEGKPYEYDKQYLRKLREKVGIVFQDPDKQIFYSNVYDDVAFGPRNLGLEEEEVKKRVEESLKEVDAYEFKDKPVHFLSHGQKKRVAIAGVLAMNSEVIFFDEPTAGLDPVVTKAIEKILVNLSENGKKIVISSHDMDLIYRICDYTYVVKKGKILKEGDSKQVFVEEEILKQAGLDMPWLVKVHKNMGYPLFRDEEDLFRYEK